MDDEQIEPVRHVIELDDLMNLYKGVLEPAFGMDELYTSEEMEEAFNNGDLDVLAIGQDAVIVGERNDELNVMLSAWVAVRPELRSHGMGGRLRAVSNKKWEKDGYKLVVGEIENPEFYSDDYFHGDPKRRLAFHLRHGARVLFDDYFQPPIREGAEPVMNMILVQHHPTEGPLEVDLAQDWVFNQIS